MKIFPLLLLFAFSAPWVFAQGDSLSLEFCQERTKMTDPTQDQKALLAADYLLQVEQLDLSRNPGLLWNARASYQSDVFTLPFENPLIEIPEIPKENFQTSLEANWTIWDGGVKQARSDLAQRKLAQQQQEIETQLYRLEQRVNELFFGIALSRQQRLILETTREDISTRIKTLEAATRIGVLLPSEVKRLKIRLLELESTIEEAKERESYALLTLAGLMDTILPPNQPLKLPKEVVDLNQRPVSRPELEQFTLNKEVLLSQDELITAGRQPKIGLFAQAGFGYPNPLNVFDTDLSPFALGGIQASWFITDWGASKRQREQLNAQAQMIAKQEEVFLRNIDLQEAEYEGKQNILREQIERQKEILTLQDTILEESKVRLDQGVITATDYLGDLNTRLQTALQLEVLRIQILQEQARYRTILGL